MLAVAPPLAPPAPPTRTIPAAPTAPPRLAYSRERLLFLLRHWHALGRGRLVMDADEVQPGAPSYDAQGQRARRPVHPNGGFENAVAEKADVEAALAGLVREEWGWRGGLYVLL